MAEDLKTKNKDLAAEFASLVESGAVLDKKTTKELLNSILKNE